MLNRKVVYVLSDHKIVRTSKSLPHFHLREVVKGDKSYVIATRQKGILETIKDSKDEYHVTVMATSALFDYCKVVKSNVVYVDNCIEKNCDVYFDLLK